MGCRIDYNSGDLGELSVCGIVTFVLLCRVYIITFMKKIALFLLVLFIPGLAKVTAQILEKDPKMEYNADSVRAVLDKAPYFSLFKDNYFVGGTTIGHKPTAANSDVKFQLSIAQRLTKSKLPFDTYLFIQ